MTDETTFDPLERAKQKRLSRIEDQRQLDEGEVSPEDLQWINGGQGLFRNSKLVRKPQRRGSRENP